MTGATVHLCTGRQRVMALDRKASGGRNYGLLYSKYCAHHLRVPNRKRVIGRMRVDPALTMDISAYWNLLRQRQALRDAGPNLNKSVCASARDVENCEQSMRRIVGCEPSRCRRATGGIKSHSFLLRADKNRVERTGWQSDRRRGAKSECAPTFRNVGYAHGLFFADGEAGLASQPT
jgi:hypothetical protein